MKLRILFGLIISAALLAMFGCGGGDGGAVAVAPQFTITVIPSAGGTITPSGPVLVTQGASQTFTITPDTGSFLSDVLVDGVSVGAVTPYTFTNVTADHTISAVFEAGAAGLPTTATVTLSTTGTLPFGSSIGTIEANMTYPTDSEPIPGALAAPFSTPFVTPTSVVVSGVALAGGFEFPVAYPGLTVNPDYYPSNPTAPVGVVAMTLTPGLLATGGIGTGEFATVTFSIAQPSDPALPRFIPTAAGFGKERGFTLLDFLNNTRIFGTSDSNFIVGPVIFR